jgi:hypothetical protein
MNEMWLMRGWVVLKTDKCRQVHVECVVDLEIRRPEVQHDEVYNAAWGKHVTSLSISSLLNPRNTGFSNTTTRLLITNKPGSLTDKRQASSSKRRVYQFCQTTDNPKSPRCR